MKRTNKADRHAAETVEERGPAKGNAEETTGIRTQRRAAPSDGLQRVRVVANRDKDAQFTALLHHVTPELLEQSYRALKRDAAPGVDGVTWREYGDDLEDRLADLHNRVHRGSYRTRPSKRSRITRDDGRDRLLGIATLEDKVIQRAVATVLGQIYEEDFRPFSYGFRPGRSQHNALDALSVGLAQRKVNWVLDADIRGYFDSIDHDWMLKFLEHRIGDSRVVRLIRKWLKAGYLEDGRWESVQEGTPQGAVISPLLGNVYLHYALDLWVEQWREWQAKGDVIIVRYADDFVMGFQYREDAERFLRELRERLDRFKLELHPDKTRLLEFGRFAVERRKGRGKGKPETFDFLGFTHISGCTRRGAFAVQRRPMAKRVRRKLHDIGRQLHRRRHDPRPQQGAWLASVLRGWFQYYAVPGTYACLARFRDESVRHWHRALRRRSHKAARTWTWEHTSRISRRWLPAPRILHPYPDQRLVVTTRGRSRMR